MQPYTIITKEYPLEGTQDVEPYYPINDVKNQNRYQRYFKLGQKENNIIFAGRLGAYQYTDMQDTVISALKLVDKEIYSKGDKDWI